MRVTYPIRSLVTPPRLSLALVMILITVFGAALGAWRALFPPVAHPLPTFSIGDTYTVDGSVFGTHFTTHVSRQRIETAPTWDRRSQNPPLAAAIAIAQADRMRESLIEGGMLPRSRDNASWVMDHARLVPFDEPCGLWFWEVRFFVDASRFGPLDEIGIVVLMDGTVLTPQRDRQ